ncbi:MAG: CocE/NonD family hydrolase [Myxococcota bacterium]
MKVRLIVLLSVITAGLVFAVQFEPFRQWMSDAVAPWKHGYRIQRAIKIPMRDGVTLTGTLATPAGTEAPYHTIYMQTPYGPPWLTDGENPYRFFTRLGYALLVQDVRGRYGSGGTFEVTRPIGNDGADTLDWIVEQPWSSGKVATFGCSYLGETQVALARKRHPAHRAMVAQGAGGAIGSARDSYGYFGVFENGVLNLGTAFGWFRDLGDTHNAIPLAPHDDSYRAVEHLPVSELLSRVKDDPTDFDRFLAHPLDDPWWANMGYVTDDDHFSTPALHVNGWFDLGVDGTFKLADVMRSNSDRAPQRVIIGPGGHCEDGREITHIGELPVNAPPFPYHQVYTDWLGHWLDGSPLPDTPAYHVYVYNRDAWLSFDRWPPAQTATADFYLGAGTLSSGPNADEVELRFTYDPLDPVPTLGGSACCTGDPRLRSGSFDQRELAARDDVLTFTSDPLPAPLTLVGSPSVEVTVASSAVDTDFTAKLIDVWPDGRAFNIRDSVLRMRYRDGIASPSLITPGTKYRVRIELPPIAWELRAGHRVELHLSSSNFPRLERNLNRGGSTFTERAPVVAKNAVYTGGEAPSRLVLPVLR